MKNSGIFSFKLIWTDAIVFIVLLGLSFFCYREIMHCNLVCDDYIFFRHAYENRHADIFTLLSTHFFDSLKELTSFQLAYRPIGNLWIVGMYKLFGLNLFAYHAVKIFLHALVGFLSYLILRALGTNFDQKLVWICASFAAIFFVVHPIQIEVVNWVVELTELCAVFYLASLLSFILYARSSEKSKLLLFTSVVLSLVSMFCKEHGVTMPLVIMAYGICFSSQESLLIRAKESLKQASPFWFALGVYLCFRFIALKTLVGGYFGVLEEGWQTVLWKWQNGHGLDILLYPLNRELIASSDWLFTSYNFVYALIGIYFLFGKVGAKNLKERKNQFQLFMFLGFWMLICLLPPAVRWMLEPNLAGSRHICLVSVPALMLLSLFLFEPASGAAEKVKAEKFYKQGRIMMPLLLSIVISFVFSSSTMANNQAWVQASKFVDDFRSTSREAIRNLLPEDKLVMFKVPHQIYGVHMFYHWSHLSNMFMPPFEDSDISGKLDAPTKYLFTNEDMVRVRRLSEFNSGSQFLYWDDNLKRLKLGNIDFPANQSLDVEIKCIDLKNEKQNVFNFDCNPEFFNKTDFVEVLLKCSKIPGVEAEPDPYFAIALDWEGKNVSMESKKNRFYLELFVDDNWHLYHFPVSESKNWLLSKKTGRLQISSTDKLAYELGKVRLIDDSKLVPKFEYVGGNKRFIDTYIVDKGTGCDISYDASKIRNASSVLLEITRPNYFFLTQSTNYRVAPGSLLNVGKTVVLPNTKGTFNISYDKFDIPATYQLRISARSSEGELIGYYADPINIEIKPSPVQGISLGQEPEVVILESGLDDSYCTLEMLQYFQSSSSGS